MAAQAGIRPAKEERALLPGKNVRPTDVFLPDWSNGQDTAIYVTVVSSLLKALVDKNKLFH